MYRIFTEDVNRAGIQSLCDSSFDGYTLIPAQGCYKGTREQSLIIEISTRSLDAVTRLAQSIKALNRQDSVLVTHVQQSEVFV